MRIERVEELNGRGETGKGYVLYWMQASVRAESNFALQFAVREADRLDLPVVTVFCLLKSYPSASPFHYRYLLEGLEEARIGLERKGIRLIVLEGEPGEIVPELAKRAAILVTDAGYLAHQRNWLGAVAAAAPCRAVRVEGDVAVPPRIVSGKEEWSAYTLRRKLAPIVDHFLEPATEAEVRRSSVSMDIPIALRFKAVEAVEAAGRADSLALGSTPARMEEQRADELPGRDAALLRFDDFLERRLDYYHEQKNDPSLDGSSRMSAALHFGFVSPVELVLRTLARTGSASYAGCSHPGAAAFLEELVVRRELAINFVSQRADYGSIACLPEWARRTLGQGTLDRREILYSYEDLEFARTEDPYWNAAQDQMVLTGRMHGYMRMYWGKRLLAWTPDPDTAWRTALRLNDAYSLDGRDPNGYAGVAWCFGKHDRPWTGRPVYGTVRYMNDRGLRRKFDMDAYLRLVRSRKEERCSTISPTPK